MNPFRIYEINTWPWLSELSERFAAPLTLGSVPDSDWDAMATMRFDAAWLMGVWERSPHGREIARRHATVLAECQRVLPALSSDRDIVGSPYSIRSYTVEAQLGGASGLKTARRKLHDRGLRLFLDYVPNHTGLDSPWLAAGEDCYVAGTSADLHTEPGRFCQRDGRIVAHGAPTRHGDDVWTDTAQVNACSPRTRELAVETLLEIARHCDGVRCDMAHLMRSSVAESNWGPNLGPRGAGEFWAEVIGKVRHHHPAFIFMAECYGESQAALVEDGFDYCYDKERFYDRLRAADHAGLQAHLRGTAPQLAKHLVRFISNHDEDPVEDLFRPAERHRAAAIAVATLPGAVLWHQPQLEGRWGKQVVQLGSSVLVRSFYQRLLVAVDRPAIRQGSWAMGEATPAPVLAYGWEHEDDRVLVVINLSGEPVSSTVEPAWSGWADRSWSARDVLSGADRGRASAGHGLSVELPAWGGCLLEVVTG
jgi:hypothetical protein